MIAWLKGRIENLKPTELILDVNGVGYHLLIPFTTYENIQKLENTHLYIYTLHKEDQLKLFGFSSENERNLFSKLIDISGIGPSMALSILSGIRMELLFEAVKNDNPAILTKIPGIGKNKAEKLIFELKRKIKKFEDINILTPQKSSLTYDSIEALISLGFDETRATMAVEEILKDDPEIPIEDLIKKALKNISS